MEEVGNQKDILLQILNNDFGKLNSGLILENNTMISFTFNEPNSAILGIINKNNHDHYAQLIINPNEIRIDTTGGNHHTLS